MCYPSMKNVFLFSDLTAEHGFELFGDPGPVDVLGRVRGQEVDANAPLRQVKVIGDQSGKKFPAMVLRITMLSYLYSILAL